MRRRRNNIYRYIIIEQGLLFFYIFYSVTFSIILKIIIQIVEEFK